MKDTENRLVTEWMDPASTIQTNKGPVLAAAWCKAEAERVPGWQVVTHPETRKIALERK